MPTLDSVSFDESGFERQGDEGNERIWYTPGGDGLGLFHFRAAPDIKADPNSVDELRHFYRIMAQEVGFGLIETEKIEVDGCFAIRTIFKAPQQPSGMTYIGSITVPFRDFSYVIKVQCVEQGMTGMRDSLIFAEKSMNGEVSIDTTNGTRLIGWDADPYDANFVGPVMRNLSEDEKYDEQFPQHPLSRARRVLEHLQATLRLSQELKEAPPFA